MFEFFFLFVVFHMFIFLFSDLSSCYYCPFCFSFIFLFLFFFSSFSSSSSYSFYMPLSLLLVFVFFSLFFFFVFFLFLFLLLLLFISGVHLRIHLLSLIFLLIWVLEILLLGFCLFLMFLVCWRVFLPLELGEDEAEEQGEKTVFEVIRHENLQKGRNEGRPRTVKKDKQKSSKATMSPFF